MKTVASYNKVGYHREKIKSYLNGDIVFPVTLELDITSRCTRKCRNCPSSRSEFQHDLPFQFVVNLIDSFEGQTKGLLLTGGEPTLSPLFPSVLKLAREKGFRDIAVVTNGSLLHEKHVIDALLSFASTIRISIYDWDDESCGGIDPVLKRIENLSKLIDSSNSKLKIGISALTSSTRSDKLQGLSESVRNAGAHWIYFHPMCSGWNDGHLVQLDQQGVMDAIEVYKSQLLNGFEVFVSKSRYVDTPIHFSSYHAAHFLMIMGADCKNYLGAEVKYQDRYVLADLSDHDWHNSFIGNENRLNWIRNINDRNYTAINSRHRGVLYNDFIEKIILGAVAIEESVKPGEEIEEFWFPHIL